MGKRSGFSINAIVLVMVLMAAIPVVASPGDTARISDSTVKVLVERELARRGLAKNEIEVAVEDHIATLSGSVSTLAEKERIAETARKAYGVSLVENNLGVRVAGDKDIAEAVRKSIVTHPYYGAFDWIEAQVNDGMVTLAGSVREPLRKSEFENRVMNIAGVSKISNEIKVLPLSTYDDEIRLRALRTIYGSSTLSRYALGANRPIHIIVENGRVVLKGVVANTMDRQVAESLVRTNLLAFDVRNELQVEMAN
ncbi:MAG TPA: BON domain-containing protein [Terriglobia bacterium]|nr:BON domain-containing protein [Terriglobia bacterium]